MLPLAGFVLEVLAVNKISHVVKDEDIFKNYLYALIIGIVGVGVAVIFGIIAAFILGISLFGIISSLSYYSYLGFLENLGSSLILLAVLILIAIWIALVIAASFVKKSFESIAAKLNVPMFKTTATLYWIGALTSIVIVGFLVLFIGNILKIVAYFNIPEETPPPSPPPPQKS